MSYSELVRPITKRARFLRLNVLTKRMFSEDCVDKGEKIPNKCTTAGVARKPCLAAYPSRKPPEKEYKPKIPYKFKSMWYHPKCCIVCEPAVAPLRHDLNLADVHWTERQYQRTWYQCPDRCLKRKACPEKKIVFPEPERRARGVGNPDAKWITKLHDCAKVVKPQDPCDECKPRKVCNKPPATCCKKRCTLYPSYSECYQRCKKPKRSVECFCLRPMGLCIINEWLNARGLLKKDK